MKIPKTIYLFFLPGLLLYSIFFLYPTVSALFYSFTDWDGLSDAYQFVGVGNYERALTGDSVFRKTVGNNLKFMLMVVVFQTLTALVFAMIVLKNTKANLFLPDYTFFCFGRLYLGVHLRPFFRDPESDPGIARTRFSSAELARKF